MTGESRTGIAFVIMQIGNSELDETYETAIVPAVQACGLNSKRVDKHNEGGLLKSEIVRFIHEADIIVADLTNERPNCYLEVGYAMGLGKLRNLILTARADHSPDDGSDARIHFDLAGYDVLFWSPTEVDGFRQRLEMKIRSRRRLISASATEQVGVDSKWLGPHVVEAKMGLGQTGLPAFMDVSYTPSRKLSKRQTDLLKAARLSQMRTATGGIGRVLEDQKLRPHAKADCIVAEMKYGEMIGVRAYEYWVLRKNGDFYTLQSLYEDTEWNETLFIETRIDHVASALIHCSHLYRELGVDEETRIAVRFHHSGLRGRVLRQSSAALTLWPFPDLSRGENEVSTEIDISLGEIASEIVRSVEAVCSDLFVVFNFAELPRSTFEDRVNVLLGTKT